MPFLCFALEKPGYCSTWNLKFFRDFDLKGLNLTASLPYTGYLESEYHTTLFFPEHPEAHHHVATPGAKPGSIRFNGWGADRKIQVGQVLPQGSFFGSCNGRSRLAGLPSRTKRYQKRFPGPGRSMRPGPGAQRPGDHRPWSRPERCPSSLWRFRASRAPFLLKGLRRSVRRFQWREDGRWTCHNWRYLASDVR